MKKFIIPCNFNGQMSPFAIYIGAPEDRHHPLHFQADWLSKERGGQIPQEVMDSVAKLKEIADRNGVSFEDLCVYAIANNQNGESLDQQTPEEMEEYSGQDDDSGH